MASLRRLPRGSGGIGYLLPLALAGGALLFGGCSSRDYEHSMQSGLDDLRHRTALAKLYGTPADLPGTHLSIRVPRAFNMSFQEGSVQDGKPIDERRVKIPGLTFPGLAVTYEARVEDSAGGRIPYYLHVFAIPRDDTRKFLSASLVASRPDTTGDLYHQIEKAFADTHSSWVQIDCPTPNETQLAWQCLRVRGEQPFHYLRSDGRELYAKMPCLLEVYARSEGAYLVLLAWRVPTSVEDAAGIAELGRLVAGTLKVSGSK